MYCVMSNRIMKHEFSLGAKLIKKKHGEKRKKRRKKNTATKECEIRFCLFNGLTVQLKLFKFCLHFILGFVVAF